MAQVEADIQRLQKDIAQLHDDQAAMQRVIARSPWMNMVGGGLLLIMTAIAWYIDGPAWLRLYAFPLYLAVVVVFGIGARKVERWMQRKTAELESFADQAQAQLAQARAGTAFAAVDATEAPAH